MPTEEGMAGIAPIQEARGGAVSGNADVPATGFFVNNGWIKLHRIIKEKAYYRKPHYLALWIHLLLSVNHEEKEFLWNGKIITVKSGQMITGRLTLSDDTGIPSSNVERILKLLENEHQIEQQKTNKYRLITVLNWEKYQKVDSKTDSKRTTNGQQMDTNKKLKKIRSKEVTSPAPEAGSEFIVPLIDSFKEVNPSYALWYGRPPQRAACLRLIQAHGVEQVKRVVAILPKTNQMPYVPSITTPVQLEEKWAQLESALKKKKLEATSKGKGII